MGAVLVAVFRASTGVPLEWSVSKACRRPPREIVFASLGIVGLQVRMNALRQQLHAQHVR